MPNGVEAADAMSAAGWQRVGEVAFAFEGRRLESNPRATRRGNERRGLSFRALLAHAGFLTHLRPPKSNRRGSLMWRRSLTPGRRRTSPSGFSKPVTPFPTEVHEQLNS
jgi:hypothetical protein